MDHGLELIIPDPGNLGNRSLHYSKNSGNIGNLCFSVFQYPGHTGNHIVYFPDILEILEICVSNRFVYFGKKARAKI